MMSGAMISAPNTSSDLEVRMLERAAWLRALSEDERDQLSEIPLREVNARFDAWRRSRAGSRKGAR